MTPQRAVTTRDMQAMLAMADKLMARAEEIRNAARQIREDMIAATCGPVSPIRLIAGIAADVCGVTVEGIKGPSKRPALVKARFLACYAAREWTTASLPQIGRALGNRDHTTVMHACREAEKRIKSGAWAEAYEAIERRLSA